MTYPYSWRYVKCVRIAEIREPTIERLVVHYDFFARYSQKNGFEILPELMTNADSVIVLTLYIPPKILIQRLNSRILVDLKSLFCLSVYREKRLRGVLRKFSKIFMRLWLNWKKLNAYKHGSTIFLYERWFVFLSQNSLSAHWVLDHSKSNIMIAHPYEPYSVEIFSGVKEWWIANKVHTRPLFRYLATSELGSLLLNVLVMMMSVYKK